MRKRANKKQKSKRDIFLKIRVSEEELEALNRLAANISANITQIAYCAKRNGYDSEKEFSEIKESMNKIWEPLRFFIGLNMKAKH